ncbi:hypothetical protein HOU96_gp13 [Arthrobacter phage Maja]|uniref:Uncharacterized protein n=1 Tax=Arthrobacter phage Maja TaxID=2499009 RepID=A0A3S9UN74_9CAUD|nr:hypothetical protein HOU96_gp13 [Arthrobacter phage Maja]AZS11711.1 hypothetical protein PBI_MAJA_13 [Arthrobacter phage Maja]
MAETEKQAVLVSPDGAREWTPEDAAQATNLRARGWSPKTTKPASKTTTK